MWQLIRFWRWCKVRSEASRNLIPAGLVLALTVLAAGPLSAQPKEPPQPAT